jgi:eukaryotic-like serine/threonine-protein kinase
MNWLREPDTEPIPGYRLIAPLGTGGFGEVWKCEAPGGIHKAIKFVYGNLNQLDDDSAKAEQEFKAIERVKTVRHPFVLTTERIDIVNGELLIVMELADRSLYDLQQEYQKLGRPGIPREMLLGFLGDTAEGLDHLNTKHNLQHLDVKPKNLFLIADRVKVADFGLVKHLERQSNSGIMGGITPVYAAPETFANKISEQSDQYSLAVVYVELLTGIRPFNGKNIRQLALQHMTEAPDLSMLPDADRAAVARALSKTPSERFPNCVAFVRSLGGASLRSDLTNASSNIIVPAANPARKNATMPEVDVSVTQSNGQNKGKKTPPPVTGKSVARFPDVPHHNGNTMSMSVSFRPEEGVLRPAILIGIGSFGRRALQQIRCRLLDRVGELNQMPCFRFMLVDTEPEQSFRQGSGPAEAALLQEHSFHAPLQPVTNYRRRQLDQLLEWLPREKLYSIPRSLRVDGNRSLGRLAFYDHYLRFMTRLRHDIQVSTHPEAIRQSSDYSGLPVRCKVPCVYVFVSASGGTSGMLMDVGFAVRRALEKFNISDAPITSFVFTGAPDDLTSPPQELANTFATLTELNHYSDTDMTYSSQYGGPEGPSLEANGLPFTATYLLPMANRSQQAFQDCISHLAGYVTHDLTTPLGTGLEKIRRGDTPAGRTPFRGFGTFGVWYPRGLLLRSAARQLCVKYMQTWASPADVLPQQAETILSGIITDKRLTPEQVGLYIANESATSKEGQPVQMIRNWLKGLPEAAAEAAGRSDTASWAEHLWEQTRDWLGQEPTTESDSSFRRGQLSKLLDRGLGRAILAWQNELQELLRPLSEIPGPRISSWEVVLNEINNACAAAIALLDKEQRNQLELRLKARQEIQESLENCRGAAEGGFNLFGNRNGRALKNLVEKIKAFCDIRIKEDMATIASQFYRRLAAWILHLRDEVAHARARIVELARILDLHMVLPGSSQGAGVDSPDVDEAMQTTLQHSNTMRVVLPYGEDHLDSSAAELLSHLPASDIPRLESILTKLVIDPRGGLIEACKGTGELQRQLATPLIEQATAFLNNQLPSEDVTEVELLAAGDNPTELKRRITSYVRAATPLASGPAEEERTFVLIPDTSSGHEYAEEVTKAVRNVTPVPVRGHVNDLMFCREQSCLRTADLYRLLEPCWDAYHQSSKSIESNPHSRFDVSSWMPLVE